MKRMFILLSLAALLLSGCAGRKEAESRDSLSIWALEEQVLPGLDGLITTYNASPGGEGLPVSLRIFPDEEALAEALNLTRPDLLFCSYRKAEELYAAGNLQSVKEKLTLRPAYGGKLGQRLEIAGDCFFPLGTAVQLLCGREDRISPEGLSDPEKLCEAALRYRKMEDAPAFSADDFAAFFLQAMLSMDEEFHADLTQDHRSDRFKYLYNLLAEAALDGALLSCEYRAVDLVESGALPLALADSRSMSDFSGFVRPVPGYRSSLRYPGDTLGFAVTAGAGRELSSLARFLDYLHDGGRSRELALESGLVPAIPEAQEGLDERKNCLMELALYYEIYLPDRDSDYIKNRPGFEAAFRQTLERLY